MLISFTSFCVKAQNDSASHKLIGLGFNMNLARTDLSESFKKPSPGFHLFLAFKNKKRLSSTVHLNVGQIVSESSAVKFIDRSDFKINDFALTNYQSLHFQLIFHIIKKPKWHLSVHQGFGFMRYRVFNEEGASLIDLPNTRATDEDYTGLSVILPSGISGSYNIKSNFGIQASLLLLNTQNDYLDNISTFGNADNNDNILSFQVAFFWEFKSLKPD